MADGDHEWRVGHEGYTKSARVANDAQERVCMV